MNNIWLDPEDIFYEYHEGWLYSNGNRSKTIHYRKVSMEDKEFYKLEKQVLVAAYMALGLSTINLLLLMTMLMIVMRMK